MNYMTENSTPLPTDSELDILAILWEYGAQTVRFVNEKQNERRSDKEIGYTTTLKLMQIMLEKNLLQRDIVERSHIYRPAASEEQTQAQLLRGVAEAAFKGSASSLVMRALGTNTTTKAELEAIKALIAQIENG